MFVGMFVVVFVVVFEVLEVFGVLLVVVVDKVLLFVCLWRGSSSLGDKKECMIESMVKYSWMIGCCLVFLGWEEGLENLVYLLFVELVEGIVVVYCSSFVGRC